MLTVQTRRHCSLARYRHAPLQTSIMDGSVWPCQLCVMCLLQAIQREAAGTDFKHRLVVAADSLNVIESQVDAPRRDRHFDWSGSTNYTEMNRKVCTFSCQFCTALSSVGPHLYIEEAASCNKPRNGIVADLVQSSQGATIKTCEADCSRSSDQDDILASEATKRCPRSFLAMQEISTQEEDLSPCADSGADRALLSCHARVPSTVSKHGLVCRHRRRGRGGWPAGALEARRR